MNTPLRINIKTLVRLLSSLIVCTVVLAIALSAQGQVAEKPAKPSDAEIRKLLPGTWIAVSTVAGKGGANAAGTKIQGEVKVQGAKITQVFNADGSFATVADLGMFTQENSGTWDVKGGGILFKIAKSNMLAPGTEYKEIVVSIDNNQKTCHLEGGEDVTLVCVAPTVKK